MKISIGRVSALDCCWGCGTCGKQFQLNSIIDVGFKFLKNVKHRCAQKTKKPKITLLFWNVTRFLLLILFLLLLPCCPVALLSEKMSAWKVMCLSRIGIYSNAVLKYTNIPTKSLWILLKKALKNHWRSSRDSTSKILRRDNTFFLTNRYSMIEQWKRRG